MTWAELAVSPHACSRTVLPATVRVEPAFAQDVPRDLLSKDQLVLTLVPVVVNSLPSLKVKRELKEKKVKKAVNNELLHWPGIKLKK